MFTKTAWCIFPSSSFTSICALDDVVCPLTGDDGVLLPPEPSPLPPCAPDPLADCCDDEPCPCCPDDEAPLFPLVDEALPPCAAAPLPVCDDELCCSNKAPLLPLGDEPLLPCTPPPLVPFVFTKTAWCVFPSSSFTSICCALDDVACPLTGDDGVFFPPEPSPLPPWAPDPLADCCDNEPCPCCPDDKAPLFPLGDEPLLPWAPAPLPVCDDELCCPNEAPLLPLGDAPLLPCAAAPLPVCVDELCCPNDDEAPEPDAPLLPDGVSTETTSGCPVPPILILSVEVYVFSLPPLPVSVSGFVVFSPPDATSVPTDVEVLPVSLSFPLAVNFGILSKL